MDLDEKLTFSVQMWVKNCRFGRKTNFKIWRLEIMMYFCGNKIAILWKN